jgi:hypothetical protein
LLDLNYLIAAEIQVEEEQLQRKQSEYIKVWEKVKIRGKELGICSEDFDDTMCQALA